MKTALDKQIALLAKSIHFLTTLNIQKALEKIEEAQTQLEFLNLKVVEK